MPELPEVETVVRSLRPGLVGRTLMSVQTGMHRLRTPWNANWNQLLTGTKVLALTRRGKWMVMQLSRPKYHLIVHLGMTGRLLIEPAQKPAALHTHFVFALDRGEEELRFFDPRRFGCLFLSQAQGDARFPQEAELGPEPFDLQASSFFADVSSSKRAIKAILLDQAVVAGVGNIYADEALYTARIAPQRLGSSLTLPEAKRLQKAIVQVLTRAIETKGSTIANFYYGDNEAGGFQHEFRAYGRTGEPCHRCQLPITRIRLAGRSTHYCQRCQA